MVIIICPMTCQPIIICREQDENVKLLTNFVELSIGYGKFPTDRLSLFSYANIVMRRTVIIGGMVWHDLCRWRTNSPVLGGASNWIGTYKKGYKSLCDVRPWRKITGIIPDDPAPFSTLKLEPRAGNTLFHHYIRTMQVRGLHVVNS